MSTLKDVLCLLAILVAYGIAGRMDYDAAVMLEEVQQPVAPADCPTGMTLAAKDPGMQTNGLPFDPQTHGANAAAAPEGDAPCASQVF